jgi:hypothetical protein
VKVAAVDPGHVGTVTAAPTGRARVRTPMSSSVIALRRHRRAVAPDLAEARDRSARRRINAAWGLLYLNTLTFVPGGVLPLPSHVGKAMTQGALPLAILVALSVNPKVSQRRDRRVFRTSGPLSTLVVRPNVFLGIVCLLVGDTLITTLQPQHLGTVYRTFRLAEFVTALWLLTPWWGRRDMLLLRCHLRWLYIALGSVLLGFLVAPGRALAQNGRLSGLIWPMFPTQVAQYAAVAAGATVVLWLARLLSGRVALAGVTVAVAILLLTHTRTALIGLVAGILVAGLSLFTINARVRKFFAASAAVVSLGVITVAGVVTAWLARGENPEGLTTLTGRTNFWALVLDQPRTTFQQIFGFGLSNASIHGLPIDSNWLASYMMEGLFGVVVCAMMLAFLFATAFFHPRGARRALGLFLVAYCTVASFTEVGFADASTYLLHLTVAASLLVMPPTGRGAA